MEYQQHNIINIDISQNGSIPVYAIQIKYNQDAYICFIHASQVKV